MEPWSLPIADDVRFAAKLALSYGLRVHGADDDWLYVGPEVRWIVAKLERRVAGEPFRFAAALDALSREVGATLPT